jgi:RHS repeat-associated protein
MGNGTTGTRTYNSLMQMTRQTTNQMDMEYRYTAGQNNGRIAQSMDWVSGEQVNYTYDSLKRLTGAATASGTWGTTYDYDGFGNLWSKSYAPADNPASLSVTYDRTTNHQDGVGYDANGNPTTVNGVGVAWDGENRLAYQSGYWGQQYWGFHGLPVPPAKWQYDPFGKRVQSPGANGAIRVSLYNLAGQVLYQMDCNTDYYNEQCVPVQSFQYFGRKLLETTDRLGSVRALYNQNTWQWQQPTYYPYGEENANPLPDGTIKFATYLRDGPGQDYAMNRYYSSNLGRFYTPDPGGINTADPKRPGSWNRYAYVNNDPVNRHDPRACAMRMTLMKIGRAVAWIMTVRVGAARISSTLTPELTPVVASGSGTASCRSEILAWTGRCRSCR